MRHPLAAMLGFAATLGLALPAHADIIRFDFTGFITSASNAAPLASLIVANDPISGYFQFDASTPDTTPGHFSLASAVFHVVYDGVTLDSTGANATIGVNRDVITFSANVPPAGFTGAAVTSATVSLGFQTFIDNYFDDTSLPTTLPPNDHTLGLTYTVAGDPNTYGSSTDTNLHVTATDLSVPEPASLSLLAAGLVGFASVRRRGAASRR